MTWKITLEFFLWDVELGKLQAGFEVGHEEHWIYTKCRWVRKQTWWGSWYGRKQCDQREKICDVYIRFYVTLQILAWKVRFQVGWLTNNGILLGVLQFWEWNMVSQEYVEWLSRT